MKFILCFLIGCSAFAQPDITTIVENDPFDPDRGRKEAVQEEVLEEEAPPPVDVPTLDGTMVIGMKKMALFSYTEEGKRKFKSVTINQVVAGYKLTQINDREVELIGDGNPVTLRLFSGEKTNRGGSKKAAKKPSKAKTRSKKGPTAKNSKAKGPEVISPNSKKKDEKPKKRFVPRKPTPKKGAKDTSKKTEKFKKRF